LRLIALVGVQALAWDCRIFGFKNKPKKERGAE
jgi:hypothetical protein